MNNKLHNTLLLCDKSEYYSQNSEW